MVAFICNFAQFTSGQKGWFSLAMDRSRNEKRRALGFSENQTDGVVKPRLSESQAEKKHSEGVKTSIEICSSTSACDSENSSFHWIVNLSENSSFYWIISDGVISGIGVGNVSLKRA